MIPILDHLLKALQGHGKGKATRDSLVLGGIVYLIVQLSSVESRLTRIETRIYGQAWQGTNQVAAVGLRPPGS